MSAYSAELQHYRQVEECEIEALRKIADGESGEGASQSGQTQAEILEMLGFKSDRKATSYIPDTQTSPRPSQFFIEAAFRKLILAERRNPEIAVFLIERLFPIGGIAVDTGGSRVRINSRFRKGVCGDAEEYFLESLLQLRSGEYDGQPKLQVYHDPDGRPLAFRKSNSETSALVLERLTDGKAVIPPGTIVGIGGDNMSLTGSNEGAFTSETYQVGSPIEITPMRLSAWAYDEELDRAMFGVMRRGTWYNSERGNRMKSATLDDFRQGARDLMTMCGIE